MITAAQVAVQYHDCLYDAMTYENNLPVKIEDLNDDQYKEFTMNIRNIWESYFSLHKEYIHQQLDPRI